MEKEEGPKKRFSSQVKLDEVGAAEEEGTGAGVGTLLADPQSRTLLSHMCLLDQAEVGHTLPKSSDSCQKRKPGGHGLGEGLRQ